MKAILDAYIKADPGNEAYYQANYDKYAAEFDQLDKEFSDALSGLTQKNIVVAHEAFGYFAARTALRRCRSKVFPPTASRAHPG
jgi:zinc transport system substrate-binding protein